MFHLMENPLFDLPHTIYINILRNLKGLGGLDDIYYATFINKLLWDQGVYHFFNNMDGDSKHTLIVKGLVVAKQQKFSKTNLKAMKVALEQTLKEALEMDAEALNKRKQKKLAKSIADEDHRLENFGTTKKIKRSGLNNNRRRKPRNSPKWMKKKRRCWQRRNIPKEGMSLPCLLLLVHSQ